MAKPLKLFKNIIFYFLLPLLVVSVFSVVILQFMGVNLPEPINNVIPSNAMKVDVEQGEPTRESLEAVISDQEQKIVTMQRMIEEKDHQIGELKDKINSLQIDSEQEESSEVEKKQTVLLIEKLRPENAAEILSEMEENEVVTILSALTLNKAKDIIAEMDPKQAAAFLSHINE